MNLLRVIRLFLIGLGHPFVVLFKIIFKALPKPKAKPRPKKIPPKNKTKAKAKKPANIPRGFHLFLALGLIVLGFGIWTYYYIFADLPSVTSLTTQPVPLTTHIRDRNGVELYKIYKNQNRTLVNLNELPQYLIQATVSIEDKDFYSHVGFSIPGIMRAMWKNLTTHDQQGGSTITQQLVKTALLTPEKTLRRKVRELVLSIAVESKYSKDQILEMYLNRVSFGGEAYGIEEASQTYFGKSSTKLTLAEAALLAGLPASPTTYSPFGAHPELAKVRQQEVLQRMVEDKYLTWTEANAASKSEIKLAPQRIDIKAPHFVMYVKELLTKKYGPAAVEQGGLDVITSLDLSVQNMTQQVVAEEIAKVNYLHIGNGAALVTNPGTGEVLAMVGSKDYFDLLSDGNVNITTSLRQPGSSIKPINYALALSRGFTPSSILDDSPITYRISGQPSYSPVNYDGKYHGKVTLRTALASSYNVPAVKILAANGVGSMIELAQKMGITTWNDSSRFGLSLTLGGGEVKMTDMVVAYGVLANQGKRVDLHSILLVKDAHGNILEEFTCTIKLPCGTDQVLDAKIAYLLSDILSDNSARSPAFGTRSDLFIPGSPVAVKTGTTNNLRDNWTLGYTSNRLVAVWVGNNDNSPMSYVASGVTGASPIWRRIMDNLLKQSPFSGFTPPQDLVKLSVCTITGELACSACPSKDEYFIPGSEPKRACSDESIKRRLEERENQLRDKLLNGASAGQ